AEVTSDYHSIAAWFESNRYIISATAGAGGYIDPAGDSTVTHGGEITYYIGAEANYHVEDVLVDGLSIGPVETYLFSSVTADHVIEAVFSAECIMGDFNNDGKIDLADAVILLQVITGAVPNDCFVAGDVNGDGHAGLEDLVYTLRKSAGLP
ncbi:MAG: dockerin type I repeat-containing protein, partial [Sedimentisphaerales bacterium]|nr:dockerin type I repeat-containing protein [Sedimentisphaerales bacterium]